jgi:hypothetical protein
MMSEEGEFTLEVRPGGATLRGVMRLASPAAYRAALKALHEGIEAATAPYELDISGLKFLNSSGITALSRLILAARERDLPIAFVVAPEVLWQKKTLPSLAKLYSKVTIRNP